MPGTLSEMVARLLRMKSPDDLRWSASSPRTIDDSRAWWFVDGAFTYSFGDGALPLGRFASQLESSGWYSYHEPGIHYLPEDTLQPQMRFAEMLDRTLPDVSGAHVVAFSLGCYRTIRYFVDRAEGAPVRLVLIEPPLRLGAGVIEELGELVTAADGIDTIFYRLLKGSISLDDWIAWSRSIVSRGVDLHIVLNDMDMFTVNDAQTIDALRAGLGSRVHALHGGAAPTSVARAFVAHSLVPRLLARAACGEEVLRGRRCLL